MLRSLVGSEMCIRDRFGTWRKHGSVGIGADPTDLAGASATGGAAGPTLDAAQVLAIVAAADYLTRSQVTALINAAVAGLSGDAGGVTRTQVLAIVAAANYLTRAQITQLIADLGTGGDNPVDNAAIDARIADWAKANSPSGTIPDNRIPATIARDSCLLYTSPSPRDS